MENITSLTDSILVKRFLIIPFYSVMSLLYIFVFILYLRNSKELSNSYYAILKGLAVADIVQMLTTIYNTIYANLGSPSITNCLYCHWFDYFVVSFKNICVCSDYALHLNIMANRLVAIMMFNSYKRIFTKRRTIYLNIVCYLFGFAAFGPTLFLKLYHFQPYKKFWPLDEMYSWTDADLIISSFTAIILTLSSLFACIYSWIKLKKNIANRSSYKMEIKMLIQSVLMSLILVVGELISYVPVNGEGVPPLAGDLIYFMFNAANPVIVLTMDKTVRQLFRKQLAYIIPHRRANIVGQANSTAIATARITYNNSYILY